MSSHDESSDGQSFLQVLRADGVVGAAAVSLEPMSGGVSSEIYLLREAGRPPRVVKRALARLKVKEEWLADVSRNGAERNYLDYVGSFLPEAVPRVIAGNAGAGYFVMEYFGEGFSNWKQRLLAGEASVERARLAGNTMGRIHQRSAGDAEAQRRFDTGPNFFQLRIDPYLLTTARRHPRLAELFEREASRLAATRECLVHGDFSPKNILVSSSRMVLLDCEVAWYGEPAFDAAFLLNHLMLKALYHSANAQSFARMIDGFWNAYGAQVRRTFDLVDLESRVERLLLMLMLARMDGKSPVEYLNDAQRDVAREFVSQRLPGPMRGIAALREAWFAKLRKLG